MRKVLSMIHTYGGFLFFPVFIILGLSALHVNHPFRFFLPTEKWTESEKSVVIPQIKDNMLLAQSLRDSLGLMGWLPDWTMHRDNEAFRFEITHNGADYRIEARLKTGKVKIKRRAKGFGSVLHSLHPFNENLPAGCFTVNSWQYYKDVSVLYVILAVISGIYFFLKRNNGKTTGIIVICSSLFLSFILMIYVWHAG